jgi:hypothetical protein
MAEVKLGALVWNQYTDWPSLRDAGVLVDSLGFDSLWTWDHVYPIVGDYRGPRRPGDRSAERRVERPDVCGPPQFVAEGLAPYVELGFRHLYADAPAPYDRETLERLVGEVKPLLG